MEPNYAMHLISGPTRKDYVIKGKSKKKDKSAVNNCVGAILICLYHINMTFICLVENTASDKDSYLIAN